MLKAELFLHNDKEQLPEVLQPLIDELIRQQLICDKGDELVLNPARIRPLQLLGRGARNPATLRHHHVVDPQRQPEHQPRRWRKRAASWRSVCRCCTASTRRSF